MLYYLATLSEVTPIPIRQFLAFSHSKISSDRASGFTASLKLKLVIDSTPHPTPMSICPAVIALAMWATACSPEEHCLFRACREVVCGTPPRNPPILEVVAPAPGCRQFPTAMSSIFAGSRLALVYTSLRTCPRSCSGAVFLKDPFLALQRAVLEKDTITTSSSEIGFGDDLLTIG